MKVVALDECDVVATSYRITYDFILKLPQTCKLLFSSATYNSSSLKYVTMKKTFTIQRKAVMPKSVRHIAISCKDHGSKNKVLHKLCNLANECNVRLMSFFSHRKDATWLKQSFEPMDINVLSSDQSFIEREHAVNMFIMALTPLLFSTDLGARGLSIDGLRFIVNYDLPTEKNGQINSKQYVQRIGRAAHSGKICSS